MSTDNGNIIIAKFMGWEKDDNGFWTGCKHGVHYELRFNSSWNELMPVIEKIGLMPFPKGNGWTDEDYEEMMAYPYLRTFGMRDKEGNYMFRFNASPLFTEKTLIRAAYKAVVDFIIDYNQSKL